MMRKSTRGLLLGVAMLAVFAVAAVPAQATITPVNTAFSGTSTDAQLVDNNGNVIRCTRNTGAGTSAADGRSISLTLSFTTSCTARIASLGITVPADDITCRVTLRSTSSVAGSNASGTVVIDSPGCSINVRTGILGDCTIDVPAQGPVTGWTLTQRDQGLSADVRGLRITSGTSGSRRACPGVGTTATFTGRYAVTPRFSIS